MTDVRRLCQTLLNGCPERADLEAVENLLCAALKRAEQCNEAAPPPGMPWELSSPPDPECPVRRRLVRQALAPTLLLDGIWLARVAQPATGHRESECHLLELYCRIMGLDDPARSPPLRFRASLLTAGVSLPDLRSPAFFQDGRFPLFALQLPSLHLGLLHRPRSFFPELLGYTLAHLCRKPAWWDGEPSLPDEAGYLALAALEAYPGRHAHEERIRAGWDVYRSAFETLTTEIESVLALQVSAEDAMAGIVRSKLPHAVGYHGRIKLQGRNLDQWLAESADEPRRLLRALRDSPQADRACPAGSRLIRAMDFGGPMFGVFDADERQTCVAWIENPDAPAPAMPFAERAPAPGAGIPPSPATARSGISPDGLDGNPRRLYTALLDAESPAERPPAADAFIRRILGRTRRLTPVLPAHRRLFSYSPEAFHARLDALHQREVRRYRPLTGPPKIDREFCRWAALQLAPAILVDGAWLAGIATAAENLGDIGRHLLKIYADELGSGHSQWNHPNVYRRLLESLDFELPDFDRDDFALNPQFLDSAFDIPVYLLAMGQSTDRYFPEVLGLNLGIELSGLGAGYMQVIDMLRYHGMDPTIIQLHLSIDNPASGHASRAREAIVLYLDEIRRRAGAEAVDNLWERIWTGYLSLNVAALGLAIGFTGRYLAQRTKRAFTPWLFP